MSKEKDTNKKVENASKENWREAKPPFILIDQIQNFTDTSIPGRISEITQWFFSNLKGALVKHKLNVLSSSTEGSLNETFPNQQGMIINPVYIGSLSDKITKALKGKTRSLRNVLRDYLPEAASQDDLSAVKVGSQLGIGLHPNFTNLVLFEDPAEIFSSLEGKPVIEFLRALMAKTGAWKIIALPLNKKGEAGRPILGTMEQGHPRIDNFEMLAYRIHVLASVVKVGGVENIDDLRIDCADWDNSKSIQNMINFGRWLGDNNFLDEPIEIKDYFRNQQLGKLVSELIRFTRQQEGAYALWTPDFGLNLRGYGLDWNGIVIVTRTGSDSGMTVKTNPDSSSFVPGFPLEKSGKFGKISVTGVDTGRPSVEAEEFSLPLLSLGGINMKLGKKTFRGPPINGIVHLHRGVADYNPEKVIFLQPDLGTYPPVGCGVDAMADLSRHFMTEAVENWRKSRHLKLLAVYYSPNHGVNILIFPEVSADGKSFIYPDDSFGSFKQAIKAGDLRLSLNVPQW